MIIFFTKLIHFQFLKLLNFFHELLGYCHMNTEVIQSEAYDNNYDDFQHVNFLFSQKNYFTILRIII
jgi:hypothetical protein